MPMVVLFMMIMPVNIMFIMMELTGALVKPVILQPTVTDGDGFIPTNHPCTV